MGRIKRQHNIPRQQPDDVQADAAASRLGDYHRVNPLRVFDWARDCGVDLSDMQIEERLFQASSEAFNYAVETGTCAQKKDNDEVLKNENSKSTADRGDGITLADIRFDFRF